MIHSEECKKFGENLSLLLCAITNINFEFNSYAFENGMILYYIKPLNDIDHNELNNKCILFENDKEVINYVKVDDFLQYTILFKFKGLAKINNVLVTTFEISEDSVFRYTFNKNIIKSMKNINRFDL